MKRLLVILSCCFLIGCQSDQQSTNTDTQVNSSSTVANIVTTLSNPLTKNYLLVFDSSGSMAGDRLEVAKTAVKKFVSIIPKNTNIGLIDFGGGVEERVELTTDRNRLLYELQEITSGGGTPLNQAIVMAYNSLKAQYNRQFEYGEYHIVVLTDGNGSDPERTVEKIASDGWCTIHTIGFKIGEAHALNSPDKVKYRSADNLAELEEGFKAVLAEAETFDITFN